MTEYKAGQRLRMEWNGGGAIEGVVVESSAQDLKLVVRNEDTNVVAVWLTSYNAKTAKIAVLAEPKPPEPTKLWAVVRDADGFLWSKFYNHPNITERWVDAGGYRNRAYADIAAVEVIFPGVDE